ncbi:MAG: ribonuclease HII [Treponema sp.]|jgi:ribonuclease HII|nr:ribonuclease HII [Treponema sp.]
MREEGRPPEAGGVIVGLDEAGRGPLAGPVAAAAVVLPADFPRETLGDSKKLSPAKREAAAALIRERAAWGIGWSEAPEIDRVNILQASLLAMGRAWEALAAAWPPVRLEAQFCPAPSPGPEAAGALAGLTAIVDGLYCPPLPIPCRALVKADARIPEVMAASILAKTARDQVMVRYSLLYPQYGYEKHKGYPTRAHREAVARHGPSPIQRLSFTLRVRQGELSF